jgi:hypothetical protein
VVRFDLKRSYRSVFEESTATGDISLSVLENTALRHVPVGRVSQSDDAPPLFSHRVHAFLDRGFLDRSIERGEPSPLARSPDLIPPDFLFWRFVKHIIYRKKCKMLMSYVTETSQLQSPLPLKCLAVPGERETEYRLDGAHIEFS